MKTFTITEEQIKELSKWKHGKRLMQDWFPKAFEKQLEVGKVYKYPSLGGGKFMFKFNGEFGEMITYGFASNGEWGNELGIRESEINDYKEATKEEWLEALKEEARKRGFKKGVKYNYVDKTYLIKTFRRKILFDKSLRVVPVGAKAGKTVARTSETALSNLNCKSEEGAV